MLACAFVFERAPVCERMCAHVCALYACAHICTSARVQVYPIYLDTLYLFFQLICTRWCCEDVSSRESRSRFHEALYALLGCTL